MQSLDERTFDLDNVVRTSTTILNNTLMPQIEQKMVLKFEEDLRPKMETKLFEDLKAQLTADMTNNVLSASTNFVKEVMMPQLQVQWKTQLETEVKPQLEAKFKEEMNNQMEREREAMKAELQSEKEELKLMREQFESDLRTEISNQVEKQYIIFHAFKKTDYSFSGDIVYDEIPINIGNGFGQDGVFSAPVSGIYFFTFSSTTSNTQDNQTYVEVMKNGSRVFVIYDSNGSKKLNNLSYSWTLELAEDDKIHMRVDLGKIYSNENLHTIFTGQLLKAQY